MSLNRHGLIVTLKRNFDQPITRILLLTIIILLGLWLMNRESFRSPTTSTKYPVFQFSTTSKYFEFKKSSPNAQALALILSEMGYPTDWDTFHSFKSQKEIKPEKIEISLHDIETLSLEEQEQLWLKAKGQTGITRGLTENINQDSKTLSYNFYLDSSYLSNKTEEDLDRQLTVLLIHQLLIASPIDYQQDLAHHYQLSILSSIKDRKLNVFSIKIPETTSWLKNIIPKVWAGSCAGVIECRSRIWVNCSCIISGSSCSAPDSNDCPEGDTCDCDPDCSEAYSDLSCADYPQSSCDGTHSCPDGYCDDSGICYWQCTAGWSAWSEWDCDTTCGDGTETRTRTYTYTDCTTSTESDTRSCTDCTTCSDDCTLCGASCGSGWCGTRYVTGRENCGDGDCEDDCDYYCGCNACDPVAPTLSSPANGATLHNVSKVRLDWSHSNWGAACNNADNDYEVCVDDDGPTTYGSCDFNYDRDSSSTTFFDFPGTGGVSAIHTDTYYWNVTAHNGDLGNDSLTRQFSTEQHNKTCSITLPDSSTWDNWSATNPAFTGISVDLVGNSMASNDSAINPGNRVRLWLEKIDGSRFSDGEISQISVNNIVSNTTDQSPPRSINYLHLDEADCTSVYPNTCSKTSNVKILPEGNYFLHCDIGDNPRRCSGNPFCPYETRTSSPSTDCTDWTSCSSSDNAYYCAGAGDADVQIINTSFNPLPQADNYTINMTDDYTNDDGGLDISWTNTDGKAETYDIVIADRDILPDTAYQACKDRGAPDNSQTKIFQLIDGNPATVTCLLNSPDTSLTNYQIDPINGPNRELAVSVRGINTTCQPYISDPYVSDWVSYNFKLVADITGTVRSDPDNTAGSSADVCQINPETSSIPTSNFDDINLYSTGEFDGQIDGTITADGSFSITVPYTPSGGPDLFLEVDNLDTQDRNSWYTCSTCNGIIPGNSYDKFTCKYDGMKSPLADADFYLTSRNLENDPWWQVIGGLVFANARIDSTIPTTACQNDPTGVCQSFLIIKNLANRNYSAGIPVTNSSSINSSDGTSDFHTDRDNANLSLMGGDQVNFSPIERSYNYFASRTDLASATSISSPLNNLPSLTSGATDIYFFEGDLIVRPASTWQVGADETMLVFVGDNASGNSSITFEDPSNLDQMIQVAKGGYLAFITEGNIIFSDSVGSEVEYDDAGHTIVHRLDPNVEGVFIADGQISINSYSDPALRDKKFIGAGTFVGWSGVNLRRNFEDDNIGRELNSWSPTEQFIYRPDLVINAPFEMQAAQFHWREVAPESLIHVPPEEEETTGEEGDPCQTTDECYNTSCNQDQKVYCVNNSSCDCVPLKYCEDVSECNEQACGYQDVACYQNECYCY